MSNEGRDVASRLVGLVSRWLPRARSGWGPAMLAELDHVEGRLPRLRFAAGCVRVALFPPRDSAATWRAAQHAIVVVAVAALVLAVAIQARIDTSPSTGGHGSLYTGVATASCVVVAGTYLLIALRWSRGATARAIAARRHGVVAGVLVGIVTVVGNTPLTNRVFAGDYGVVAATALWWSAVAGIALAAGVLAAREAPDQGAAPRAGLWAGLTAGVVLILGLLSLTLFATGWFIHDPTVIALYRDSLSPLHGAGYHTHYGTIAGFVMSENSDTALLLGLIGLPLICTSAGALGGALGAKAVREPHC